jgi:ubiquinone/menaquinone biosynthesis C-methylase UbiE
MGILFWPIFSPKCLKKRGKELKKEKSGNVEYYLCDGQNFELPVNHFDRIFLVTVLGEVENRDVYLSEFYRMLKPGGLLSVSEQAGDPDKLTIGESKQLALKSGFVFDELFGNKRNYTINFRK